MTSSSPNTTMVLETIYDDNRTIAQVAIDRIRATQSRGITAPQVCSAYPPAAYLRKRRSRRGRK